MTRVMMIVFSMCAPTLMGMGVVAVLTAGMVTSAAIIGAAAVGFLLAIPVSWLVAKRLV